MELNALDIAEIVRITDENGIQGIGESCYWSYPKSAEETILGFKDTLIGIDSRNIEHIWNLLWRNNSCFRGNSLSSAISAIDIALWDIKGKKLDLPIYELLSGKTRDKVRCYMHISGKKTEELVRDAREKVDLGFTAIRFTPYSEDFYLYKSLSE